MQDLARQLHIDRFEEIIAVGALYRPGPMEMIPSFINRKHGREEIEIDHPKIAGILAETYGIMVYQEQVMQIASLLAGYSLGEGDVLRRAMGKKDKEEMANQREKFKSGAKENGLDEATALHIFDKIEKFASYGFNKSHAAAYGYLSYVTAYFKANYPREWMAALMTCDRDDISRVAKIIRECRAMEIAILPPDINESGREFLATPGGIRFALTGIKGVGEGVVECIIEERVKSGAFVSFQDFFKRIDTRKVGKKAIEQLIEAGCFDFTKCSRQQLVHNVEPFYQRAAKEQKEANKGIINLFAADAEAEQPLAPGAPAALANSPLDLLKKEKELLGFYLSGHPLDQYRQRAKQLSSVELEQAIQGDHDAVFRCAFVIEGVQVKLASRSQRKFAVLIVSDSEEPHEMTLWSDLYESKGQLLEEGKLLYAVLQVDKREMNPRFVCRWIEDFLAVDEESVKACDLAYDRARMQARLMDGREKKEGDHAKKPTPRTKEMSKKLLIDISLDQARLSHIVNMREIFEQMAGDGPVTMRFYKQKDLHSEIFIDASWGVKIENALRQQLEKIPSVIGIKIEEGT
jgi:DNA polymerase-3 subunit alpha